MTEEPTAALDDTGANAGADPSDPSLAEKDPSDWVTGGEPATASQMSYLATLAAETRSEVPAELSKADASKMIDELQGKSPRVDGEPG